MAALVFSLVAPWHLITSEATFQVHTSVAVSHDMIDSDSTSFAATAESPGSVQPERVIIPAIGVDADVIELGLNPDRTLEVPSDFDTTGWYTGRSVPGEPGPSVIAGHVDTTDGPAVFYRLRDLDPGDVIEITRSDGISARFEVTETRLVEKTEFPTEAVYGPVEGAALRLITCGGTYDQEQRSYRSNLVVFADHVGNSAFPSSDRVG